MRDPIENVTRLQKQLNNLQLENQVLKNILDKAGLSYQNELASIRKTDTKEDFDPEQGKRIVHPKEITDRTRNSNMLAEWLNSLTGWLSTH